MALLVGVVVFLFWRVLFTSDMLFFRDIFNYSYPHARFIHEVCRQGNLPYWNPYLNWGQPLLENPLALFFYPSTLLIVLLPIDIAYSLHYVLHFSIAAVGTYLLARRWGQSRLAAFIAGGVFTFSGPILSLGNFYNVVACAVWLPWALLFTDSAATSRSLRPWILLTGVFALQFLAGEPFTLMATFVLSAIYALSRAGSLRRPLSRENLRILGSFVIMGFLIVALSAVQFFPSLTLLMNSRRGQGMAFKLSTYWSFHPLLLLEVVVPEFFGSAFGTPSAWKYTLNFRNTPFLLSFFVGCIPILLALAGWAFGRDHRRKFTAIAALTLLFLAMGRFTPLYELAYAALPTLRLVRFPVKLLIPSMLLLAILAGWGVDALRMPDGDLFRRRYRMRVSLAIALVFLISLLLVTVLVPDWITAPAAVELERMNHLIKLHPADEFTREDIQVATQYLVRMFEIHLPGLIGYALGGLVWMVALEQGKGWARRATPWVALAGVILLVDVNYGINPTVPKSFYTYRSPALDYMKPSAQPDRLCYLPRTDPDAKHGLKIQDYLNFDSIPEAAGLSMAAQSLFREKLLLHWGTMLTGYENGSDRDVDGSLPRAYYDFWAFLQSHEDDVSRYDCLLGRTNVKYIIARDREESSATRELAEVFNGSPQPSYLYEDLCAVPRTFAVASATYSPSVQETLTKLSDPEYDALGQVILATEPSAALPSVPPAPAGEVEMVDRHPNTVTLRANLTHPGYVVLMDRFDPNWHATVDGREVPILRANQMFRAVECEAGRHEIRFFYRQAGLAAGAVLSGTTLVLLAILYFWDPGSRKPERN